MQIKIKRVYESAEPGDGFRVLVDRLWPRGMKKERLTYDLWEKEIAPSSFLRQWYHQDPENRWNMFKQKYVDELESSPAMEEFIDKVKEKKVLTLLYASKNTQSNHAVVLREYMLKMLS